VARKPRFTIPGVPQHIVQRGNNREPCFFAPEDYRFYLDSLRESADKFRCAVHAYVLMTNHVHLLVTPGQEGAIGRCLQSVGRRYVRYVNRVYRRSGTLWEGRYKASLIDTETYLLTCYRYIELNPVRAGMVVHPGDYHWSSHRHNAAGQEDEALTPHPEYRRLGPTPELRQHAYRELFRDHLTDSLLHAVRETLNQELVLGSERFKDKIEATLKRRVRPGIAGRPRQYNVEEETGEYVAY
jgi:putative transposase